MSLTADFSTSQTLGFPESINFVDTSTGSDSNVNSRRVYLRTAASTYLVAEGTTTVNMDENSLLYGAAFTEWAIDTPNTLDPITTTLSSVLDKDYALQVIVEWVSVEDNIEYAVAQYSVTKLIGYTFYNETFDYQLTQILSGNPLVINDNNFFPNKSKLRTCIDSGNQAIDYGVDIFSAQECYDQATNLRLGSVYYFNANS